MNIRRRVLNFINSRCRFSFHLRSHQLQFENSFIVIIPMDDFFIFVYFFFLVQFKMCNLTLISFFFGDFGFDALNFKDVFFRFLILVWVSIFLFVTQIFTINFLNYFKFLQIAPRFEFSLPTNVGFSWFPSSFLQKFYNWCTNWVFLVSFFIIIVVRPILEFSCIFLRLSWLFSIAILVPNCSSSTKFHSCKILINLFLKKKFMACSLLWSASQKASQSFTNGSQCWPKRLLQYQIDLYQMSEFY